ncbi:MAG: hypothetical protein QXV22_01675 [Thermoplasmataceae archaeon]
MKGSTVAIIVAIIIVVGAAGYVGVKYPGLLSLNNSSALPETAPGMRIPASSEVNASMGGSWVEVMNITIGVSNVSGFYSTLSKIQGTGNYFSFSAGNASSIQIRYAQGALFGSSNRTAMVFAYAAFNTSAEANQTNASLFRNISKQKLENISYGEVSGAFYVYGFREALGNYSSAIYALYSNYIMVALYYGKENHTENAFTSLVSKEVSILNAYKLNFAVAERLLQGHNVTAVLGSSFQPDFNLSIYVTNQTAFYAMHDENSFGQYLGNYYGNLTNASTISSSALGLALTAFSSSDSVYLLGYLKGDNSTAVSKYYANITHAIHGYFQNFGEEINNTTYNGLQFVVYNFSVAYLNYTVSIGHKGTYLVFEVFIGSSNMATQLTNLMEAESYLIP